MSDSDDRGHIDLPAPTIWPLVVALGLTLIFAGLVMHWAMSLVGLVLTLWGATGWFRDIYPHEKHEAVPVAVGRELEILHVPTPRPRKVELLEFGKGYHRMRIPVRVHPLNSGIYGGIVGGAVMAVLALLYGIVMKGSLWWPVNLLSASVLPSLAAADIETLKAFSLSGLVVGIVIHAILSILIGLMYAAALPMFPHFAWLWAGMITPLFWSALFYATAGILAPRLSELVDWPWFIVCQLGYGMIGGYVVARSQEIDTMQTYSMAVRAGVEAMQRPSPDTPPEQKPPEDRK